VWILKFENILGGLTQNSFTDDDIQNIAGL